MAKQTAPRKPAPPVEVVDAIDITNNPDIQLATTEAGAITAFMQGVVRFFRTAQQLETSAKGSLEKARLLKLPTSAAEDEAIQQAIKMWSLDRKGIEKHWEICSTVSQFHRRLVAHRQRGVLMLEEAASIGNNLHNRYTNAEKQRVAIENDRIRREAEDRAREDRAREVARMDAEALEAEASAPQLSEREQHFVELIANGYNTAPAAARAAGYKSPDLAALRLLGLPKIEQAIKALRDASTLRKQAAAMKMQPIEVEVEEVRPNITKAAGATDRTTWGGEVTDAAATIEAFRNGKHGIPGDLFEINQAKLNDYGRALHERLDLWPGVRHTKKTGVV